MSRFIFNIKVGAFGIDRSRKDGTK